MRHLIRFIVVLWFTVLASPAFAAFLCDNAWMTTPTTGTGTITLGSAVSGAQSFAACGITNGQTVRYRIFDSAAWEVGSGTYTTSGTTLSRTPTASSNAGSAINLSGSATVVVTALTADLPSESTPTDGTVSTSAHLFALESGVLSRYSVSNFIAALDGAGLAVDGNGLLVPAILTSTKTGSYTVVAADRGSVVAIGTNAVTLTLTAASTLGNGFWFIAANDNGTGSQNAMTIDPNGSETIDGVTTSTDYSGAVRLVYTDGSNWFSRIIRGGYIAFGANGNFIMPNAVTSLRIEGWGGGGGGGGGQSGATATARTGGTGGGGGAYYNFTTASSLWGGSGATIAVVVGSAGTAGTGTSGASGGNGGAGGNTTFGGGLIAAGGGGGAGGAGAARGGGTGAGKWKAGNTAPTAASAGGGNPTTNVAGAGEAGGGSTTNVNTNPMPAQYGGGAGGGTLTAGGAGGPGGTSGFGGAGGGGGAGITTGNAAAAGGAGGATNTWSTTGGGGGAGGTTSGTAGTAGSGNNLSGGPGGGGGGTNGTSTCGAGGDGGVPGGGGGGGAACLTGTAGGVGGAGGRGELRIWYSELVPANDNLPADEAMAA